MKEKTSTIRLNVNTIQRLKDLKLVKMETFEEVMNRILDHLNGDGKIKLEKQKK